MPGRPTKKWWKDCTRGVSRSGGAVDPKKVCGSVWSKKPIAEKRRITKRDERPRKKSGRYVTESGETLREVFEKSRERAAHYRVRGRFTLAILYDENAQDALVEAARRGELWAKRLLHYRKRFR